MTYLPKQYKIKNIKKLTKDVKLLRIISDINPKPGQFFEVSILGIGECPLASCSYNKKYLEILLHNVGGVTSSIFNLKTKNNLFIRGPYGNGFPIEKFYKKNIILIAGGSGIAPIMSLISYIEQNKNKFNKIFIFLGFKNKESILLKERIEKLNKKFKIIITLDKKPKNSKYEEGFIPKTLIKHNPVQKDSIAVLCGPETLMKKSTQTLKKLGLKETEIYWSMERRMECGLGNCGRCLIQDVYVCKDGPVFRYSFIKPKLNNENSSNKIKS